MAEENQEKGFVSEESFRRAVSRLYDLFVRRKDGYGLSKNDFTDEEKEKLAGLENYELPVATKESIGGVIAGDGLDIDEKGKLSVLFPDLSKYATFNDIRNENSNTDLRLVKLELAAKQNKNDDEAFKAAVAERMTTFEDRVAEVKRQASDNAQHFDDYVSNESHDLDMADILNRLSGKADIETLNEAIGKKITRSDLDGALNNLLSTLQSEQQNAANDRENIRTIKSDIVSLNNLRKLVKANVSDIDYLFKALQNCLTPDALNDYMKKVPGLGLSERSFTNEDWSRLQSLHNYTLPAANGASLGGVKIGKNINVEEDGTISVELPDASGFAYKKDCEEAVDNLDRSIAACNLRIDAERDSIGNLESSVETVQGRVTSAENAIKDHTAAMAKLALKDELAEEISAMDRAKVSITEFERHANKKISTDDLDDDVRSKVNSTVSMSVDVSDLKRKEKGNESDITRCVNYINELSSRVATINDNLLGDGDYVKPVEGKELSTNDFTNSYKEKLDNSLTVDDIGSKVPMLRTDGTLDPDCFPEEGYNVKYTDDVSSLTVGRSDVLYFNRANKKLYYYDGVNFNKVRDDSWGDDGVDIRTAMMDIFAKKSSLQEAASGIESLEERYTHLQEQVSQAEYAPNIFWQAEQPENAPLRSLWLNPSNKKMMVQTEHGWEEFVVGKAKSLDNVDEGKIYSAGDVVFSNECRPGSCLVCVRGTD